MDEKLPNLRRLANQRVTFGCVGVLALWLAGADAVSDAWIRLPPVCVGRDMLRFKEASTDADAVEVRFTIANQKIIGAAEYTHDQHGHACIVTAGKDGRHKRASKHYDNQALDFRTWHLSGQPNPCLKVEDCSPTCKAILEGIKMRLGKDYDVLFETDKFDETGRQIRWQHIHAEFDKKS